MILVWLVAVLPTDHEAIKPNNHDSAGRVALIVGIFNRLPAVAVDDPAAFK
jgi:hypothetical protein